MKTPTWLKLSGLVFVKRDANKSSPPEKLQLIKLKMPSPHGELLPTFIIKLEGFGDEKVRIEAKGHTEITTCVI